MSAPPFDCFTVQYYDDESATDDVLFPLATSSTKSVLLTELDGLDVKRTSGTGFALVHQGKQNRHVQAELEDVGLELVVTDVRVAIAVPRFEKGGGWGGGIAGLALSAASKARAASRNYGACLVGHIRFPWVLAVGHSARFGLGGKPIQDRVRVKYVTEVHGSQVPVFVEIDLSKGIDGHSTADGILRRVAEHRLARHPSLTEEQRGTLQQRVSQGIPKKVERGRWTDLVLPGAKLASSETAYYPFEL